MSRGRHLWWAAALAAGLMFPRDVGAGYVQVVTPEGLTSAAVVAGNNLVLEIRCTPGPGQSIAGLAYTLKFPDQGWVLLERAYAGGWDQGTLFDNSVPRDLDVPPETPVVPSLYPTTVDEADIRFDNAYNLAHPFADATKVETLTLHIPVPVELGTYQVAFSTARAYDAAGNGIDLDTSGFELTVARELSGPPCGGGPRFGFNLPCWRDGGPGTAAWAEAVDQMFAAGVRDVAFITYRFVDETTGGIAATSTAGLAAPPPDAEILAAMLHAKRKGMRVTLNPFLYREGDYIGHHWRGHLRVAPAVLPAFFASYSAYIAAMAELAELAFADRMMIGSELEALTGDVATHGYWPQVIAGARNRFGGILTYAANWTEYQSVPFWGGLDEIAVDAYFSLATAGEAQGVGLPLLATVEANWQLHMDELKTFAAGWDKPVLLAEWGCIPFDMATTQTWNWYDFGTPDEGERNTAYQATVNMVAGEGDWLSGVFFWHWSMPGNSDSLYAVETESAPVATIGNQIGEIHTYVAELGPGWTAASFPLDPQDFPVCGLDRAGGLLQIWQARANAFVRPSTLAPLASYWIHSSATVFLVQEATAPGAGRSEITAGWSTLAVAAETALADLLSLPGTAPTVWAWNSQTQSFFSFGAKISGPVPTWHQENLLQPTQVYWLRSSQAHPASP